MQRLRIACFGLAALLALPASAADGEYLFDVLKKPPYRQSWNAMMSSGKPPQWLSAFSRGGNGVASPGESRTVEGVRYELGHVCKPRDCGDNRFQVIFSTGGGKAWGLLVEEGRQRFFGDPSPAQRTALQKAMAD